jgi:ABC-2 type transport system ATP-binding protein
MKDNPPNEAVIRVQHLGKVFRRYKKEPGLAGAFKGLWHREFELTHAVRDVSFSIQPGEFVGFLGPNGAGKTTTLKMLSGLLHPTSGDARVLGFAPWERRDEYRRQFALLLGQKNQLWWDLPARESLELNAKIYGLDPRAFEATLDELSSMLAVGDKLGVMVRELSLGERMKFELIASLLHQPKVLFLDEPTIGLDVTSQKIIREFLLRHNQTRHTTIVLTSHYMADIEALCPRVIIIDKGTLFFDGLLAEILDRFAGFKLVSIQCGPTTPLVGLHLEQYGEVVEADHGRVLIKVPRERVIAACKNLLDALPVQDIDIQEVPIEDVIRQIFASHT